MHKPKIEPLPNFILSVAAILSAAFTYLGLVYGMEKASVLRLSLMFLSASFIGLMSYAYWRFVFSFFVQALGNPKHVAIVLVVMVFGGTLIFFTSTVFNLITSYADKAIALHFKVEFRLAKNSYDDYIKQTQNLKGVADAIAAKGVSLVNTAQAEVKRGAITGVRGSGAFSGALGKAGEDLKTFGQQLQVSLGKLPELNSQRLETLKQIAALTGDYHTNRVEISSLLEKLKSSVAAMQTVVSAEGIKSYAQTMQNLVSVGVLSRNPRTAAKQRAFIEQMRQELAAMGTGIVQALKAIKAKAPQNTAELFKPLSPRDAIWKYKGQFWERFVLACAIDAFPLMILGFLVSESIIKNNGKQGSSSIAANMTVQQFDEFSDFYRSWEMKWQKQLFGGNNKGTQPDTGVDQPANQNTAPASEEEEEEQETAAQTGATLPAANSNQDMPYFKEEEDFSDPALKHYLDKQKVANSNNQHNRETA